MVVEFDGVRNPLGEWCVQQQECFESLPPLEVTPEQLLEQQKTFEAVVADIEAHSELVERTEEVALKFVREAEVCVYVFSLLITMYELPKGRQRYAVGRSLPFICSC